MDSNDTRGSIYLKNLETGTKIVVLDDDPTGCQTVHDIVLTFHWDTGTLKKLIEENDCFYILTNSRALPGHEAYDLIARITGNLVRTGYPLDKIRIICRSDSTLRGHFMEETQAVYDNFQLYDGLVVVPFFKEGGRLTKDDTHYVVQDGKMVPANQTEFARDPSFGYRNAWLPAWIEEKSDGRYKKETVASISLEEIRSENFDSVYEKLMSAENGAPIIVNAMEDSDVDYFCTVLQVAEERGKRFLYRSGASFVKIRAGITDKPLYVPVGTGNAGLIIVGSYVNKTTRQVSYLLDKSGVHHIELLVERILSDGAEEYKNEIIRLTDKHLEKGETLLIFTERELKKDEDPDKQLMTGEIISLFISSLVEGISVRPGYILSKGGITSHQVALNGLKIKEARVLGQIMPGVPVIRTDSNAGIPDVDYIIFPGNVGTDSSLYEILNKYSKTTNTR
jgi:uncharacterized protein YgbK (DUF1537 family)